MITLLVTQLVLTLLTVQGFEYKIDPDRCKTEAKDAACFVRESCIIKLVPGTEKVDTAFAGKKEHLVHYTDKIDHKLDNKCDVIMQIKPLTKKKWHVMIQVKKGEASDAKDLNYNEGITFKQNNLLFKCKANSIEKGALEPSEMGANQIYSSEIMFCSILIEKDTIPDMFAATEYDGLPTISYTDDQENNVAYQVEGKDFWELPRAFCDPSLIKSESGSTSRYILHEIDTTLSKFTCSDSGRKLLVIYNGNEQFPTHLQCKAYKYVYPKDEGEEKIPPGANMEIYCAEEFCSKCSDLQPRSCTGCDKPDSQTGGNCKTATCGTKKWRRLDGSLADAAVECKRSEKDKTKAGWFMTIGSDTKEITEGACSDTSDCALFSDLELDCGSTKDCEKATVSTDGQTISCNDGYEIKFGSKAGKELKCNATTGLYDSADAAIARNSKVYCAKPSSSAAAAAQSNGGGNTMAIVLGITIPLLIIIAIVVFICLRRRRAAEASRIAPASMANTEGMKTAEPFKSKESRMSKSSGSEAPPSTDRPSKEKMPDSEEKKEEKKEEKVEKKEKKEEEKKKEEKKEEKEEKKKEEKKEEKKKEEKKVEVKEEEKEEIRSLEKRISADKVAKIPRLSMESSRQANKPANPKNVMRDLKSVPKTQPNPLLVGKRVNALDFSVAMQRRAAKPGSLIKEWNNSIFDDQIIDIVTIFDEYNRLVFLRSLVAFNHYKTSGANSGCGTLQQFFDVVRECYERNLECQKTWEMIYRLIKIFCFHLPQTEAASVIKRMREMMVKIAHKLLEPQGLVRRINDDTPEHLLRREFAMRVLMWAEDPAGLEELKRQGDAKADEVDEPVQTAIFAHGVKKMDKKAEYEARFAEDVKEGRTQHPKKEEKPFGTLRQHLIFALATDDKTKAEFLTKITDLPERRSIDCNPTDLLHAFKGATESCENFDAVLKAFEFAIPEDLDVYVDSLLEQFGKTAEEKDNLKKLMKKDLVDIAVILGENCVTGAQWQKLYRDLGGIAMYTREHGREDFDAKKTQERVENLEIMLKDKKCIEWLDEALKKFEKPKE